MHGMLSSTGEQFSDQKRPVRVEASGRYSVLWEPDERYTSRDDYEVAAWICKKALSAGCGGLDLPKLFSIHKSVIEKKSRGAEKEPGDVVRVWRNPNSNLEVYHVKIENRIHCFLWDTLRSRFVTYLFPSNKTFFRYKKERPRWSMKGV